MLTAHLPDLAVARPTRLSEFGHLQARSLQQVYIAASSAAIKDGQVLLQSVHLLRTYLCVLQIYTINEAGLICDHKQLWTNMTALQGIRLALTPSKQLQ